MVISPGYDEQTICAFEWVILVYFSFDQFVLAKVFCGAGPIPHASVGNNETLQKIIGKSLNGGKVDHMNEVE